MIKHPISSAMAGRRSAAALLWLCMIAPAAAAQDLLNDTFDFSGGTLHLQHFADPGADDIISMTTRPGDASLYVTTQHGLVYAVDPAGNATTWFDYDAAVSSAVTNAADGYVLDSPHKVHGGMRSVAFHPEYETNGLFYTSAMIDRPSDTTGINYLGNSTSGFDAESAVVEWTYNHTASQVDTASYRELFRVQMPRFDHPIKQLAFNPLAEQGDADYGLLYIAHGDGSVQSATAGGGQNTDDALGKVLRINPLQDGAQPYTTPGSAFSADADTLDEIFTLGHRNPHHLGFGRDAEGNSHVLAAEPGRDNIEEVNLLENGGNYGWSDREGTFIHNQSGGGYIDGVSDLPSNEWALNDYIYPVAQYDHDAVAGTRFHGSAIAGGFVIDNASDPDLQGQYLFADFGSLNGNVYHVALSDAIGAHTRLADGELPGELTQAEVFRLHLTLDSDGDGAIDRVADDLNDLLQVSRNDVRFGRGINGEMYLSSKQTGVIYRVTNSVTTLAGDFNADGFVGVEDLDILLANWGDTVATGLLARGDGSADGVVGADDLALVLDHWGAGVAPGSSVPEPGSLAVLVYLGAALMGRRRFA